MAVYTSGIGTSGYCEITSWILSGNANTTIDGQPLPMIVKECIKAPHGR
jgi:hypothetical protein